MYVIISRVYSFWIVGLMTSSYAIAPSSDMFKKTLFSLVHLPMSQPRVKNCFPWRWWTVPPHPSSMLSHCMQSHFVRTDHGGSNRQPNIHAILYNIELGARGVRSTTTTHPLLHLAEQKLVSEKQVQQ